MKIITLDKLNKKLFFPTVRAIPSKTNLSILQKINKFLTDRREWEVREDYVIWCDYLQKYIFVPKGFIFDAASIPKIFHSILGSVGILLLGSCPHDEGYRYGGFVHVNPDGTLFFKEYPKKEIDNVFVSLCQKESSLGAVVKIAKLIFILFGSIAWKNARKNNHNINKDFPGLF